MAAKPIERRDIEDALERITARLFGLQLAIDGLTEQTGDTAHSRALCLILEGVTDEIEELHNRLKEEDRQ